jgi:hypothetical protein
VQAAAAITFIITKDNYVGLANDLQRRRSRSAPPLTVHVVATQAAERHGVKICAERLDGRSPKLSGTFLSEHVLHIYRLYDVFCIAGEIG